MTKLTGAQALVRSLDREGIEMVFGIPGNHSMPIFDALYHHPRIHTMTVRHEQAAAFMADGYARASGRIAAVLTLPGPGLTNALTALGEAFTDSSPMLLLATQVNRPFIDQDRGLLHELTGQFEVAAAFTNKTNAFVPQTKSRAASAGRWPRCVPVARAQSRWRFRATYNWRRWIGPTEEDALQAVLRERACPPAEAIAAAALALHQAERPLIIAGGGVISSEASDVLLRLAERLGAPVLTTGNGVGSIPGDHPLACGIAWAPSADIRPLVGAADSAPGRRNALQRSYDARLGHSVAADHDPHRC